jgi:hypothetical protein
VRPTVISIYSPSSLIEHIVEVLAPHADVHLWAVDAVVPAVAAYTRGSGGRGRLHRLNMLEPYYRDAPFVLFTDDDIAFEPDFLPRYCEVVGRLGFDLAQPALSFDSFHGAPQVIQRPGVLARQTHWVEQMCFSMTNRLLRLASPFPEDFNRGWALEMTWARAVSDTGMKAGIIDALPVAHSFRPLYSDYSSRRALVDGIRALRRRGLALMPLVSTHYFDRQGARHAYPLSMEAAEFVAVAEQMGVRQRILAMVETDAAPCDRRFPTRIFEALAAGATPPDDESLPPLLRPVERYVRWALDEMVAWRPATCELRRRVQALRGDDRLCFVAEVYSAPLYVVFDRVLYGVGAAAPLSKSVDEPC